MIGHLVDAQRADGVVVVPGLGIEREHAGDDTGVLGLHLFAEFVQAVGHAPVERGHGGLRPDHQFGPVRDVTREVFVAAECLFLGIELLFLFDVALDERGIERLTAGT